MPVTEENAKIKDWDRATVLVCPHIRYICGVWLALNENPCFKRDKEICRPCLSSSRHKLIVIKNGVIE